MRNKKRVLLPLLVCLVIGTALLVLWFFSRDEISPGMLGPDTPPAAQGAETVKAELETVTEW